jgi:hypothetical protein
MVSTGVVRAPVAGRTVWLAVIAGLVLSLLFALAAAGSVQRTGGAPNVSARIATSHAGHPGIVLASMIGDSVPYAGEFS